VQRFAGIDLAWTAAGRSGLAVLDDQGRILHCSEGPYDDGEIADILYTFRPLAAVSVDSPLSVPNETGGRACDSELMRHRFHGRSVKVFATSRSYMKKTYGCIRGEMLREVLEERCGVRFGYDLCETFPTAVVAGCFPDDYPLPYKIKSRRTLDECREAAGRLIVGIRTLGISGDVPDPESAADRNSYKAVEDRLDALLCAVNSLRWKTGGNWVGFGDGSEGFTIIAQSRR
jgi:predicted RNase H-like nuclease